MKETMCNLANNSGLGHLKAIVEPKCLVCHASYRGGIRAPWGIPAHPECTKGLETNVRYVNGSGIPRGLMPLVHETIPVNIRGGYSSYHGQFEYLTVIQRAIPGVIPFAMTLEYFYRVHADRVSAWLERVRAEEAANEEKCKRAAEEHRVARQKRQKLFNEGRRASIENMVDTTYFKWMRMVPKHAKKFVSKLSTEQSVAAVAIIRANADLSDQAHEAVLEQSRGDLRGAYALLREYGDQALVLLRRGYGAANARGILVSRERHAQKRAEVAKCAPSGLITEGMCACGSLAAMKCRYNICGRCCPRNDCQRRKC